MTEKFQNKYRVPSARAPWHGYNGGVYFVTICTQNREHYFGEITCDCRDVVHRVSTKTSTVIQSKNDEPQMILLPIGQYAHKQFVNVKTHYPYAEIPLFVVMPNHIHAIVIIDGEKIPNNNRRNGNQPQNDTNARCNNVETWCNNVETRCTTSLQEKQQRSEQMTDICNMQGWLSVVIGGLKRAITHFANQNNIPFVWQPRFHDRIVRNLNEINRIAEYIEKNVMNWRKDELI
ncbi:MAG: hypothetical protein MJ197_08190 [Bacteroidales bacterium]|nr:hypothetical protein [Bacteroidales bacterium]